MAASYVSVGGLKVHPTLITVVEENICPGTGLSPEYFWSSLGAVVAELEPEVDRCLKKRDELQAQIDEFYQKSKKSGQDTVDPKFRPVCHNFLREIGYLVPDCGPVALVTQDTDEEVADIAGPQLVCPSDNPRFLLNAVNSRWGSLFDAVYGFDVIPETEKTKKSGPYNPVRGEAVIEFANSLLDEVVPLVSGKWSDVVRVWPKVVGAVQQLELVLKSGEATGLQTPSLFVGSSGFAEKGSVFFRHNSLHMILEIDRGHSVGAVNPSGMKDITMEAGVTTIMDMEDSVSAVDAEDKAQVYRTVNGVFRGTLSAPMTKGGQQFTRSMNEDIHFRDAYNDAATLHGRSLCLVRNVGHHMYTDAVLTEDGRKTPEGILDCWMTVASALHDLNGTSLRINSKKGSVYIVKPKMHGPEEVHLTTRIFGRAEEAFGLNRNTIKVGIMDEERRTSANLKECVRAAAERVFFINTGFLDRTGDEIHTAMHAGPLVRKGDMKLQPWFKSYEASNVDVGLHAGFQGKAQIGKGMWAKPDMMKDMLIAKINELIAGATTAWVPSPTGATLHAVHYHRVHVPGRQMQIAMRNPTPVEDILNPPLLQKPLTPEEITHELRETAQSVLGYVVRWIDLGVGCSKVPDLSDVGLMEDRATLRISSQLMANWMLHGLITKDQLIAAFKEMAVIVDKQNASDKAYQPMAPNYDGKAFEAALKLCFDGMNVPNGYTEYTLHDFRQQVKSGGAKAVLKAKL